MSIRPVKMTPCPEALRAFLEEVTAIRREFVQPADIVLETAPLMVRLIECAEEFLREEHLRPHDAHYARNVVHSEQDGSMSLFCLVWKPGQWTPVHDHGSWGVVGVVKGALQERNYIRTDKRDREDSGITLMRGGTSILLPGTVTTFVPNPDHIHRAGVPRDMPQTVTLHLYGRNMDNYNVYDMELGRRRNMAMYADNEEPKAHGI
jgi:3-mercaptopropionate dioxygenase